MNSRVLVIGLGSTYELTSPNGEILDLAASPDGRHLVAANRSGSVEVWSLADRKLRAILRGHRERVSSLSFDNGGMLATTSWDGSMRLWDLSPLDRAPEELISAAQTSWGESREYPIARPLYQSAGSP